MTNWSEQEDSVLKAGYETGRPVSEIAEALGRTPGAVRGRASALGVVKAKPEDIEKIGFEREVACPFCGQISLTGDECNCPGARRDRKIKDQIERAVQAIDEIFGEACSEEGYKPVSEDNIDIMNAAAVQIANYKMHAVSFVLSSGTRAKLTRGAKGVIKVERSETKKASTEVEE
mgnify:CR=1 FL=1